jgi:hypothetical protein
MAYKVLLVVDDFDMLCQRPLGGSLMSVNINDSLRFELTNYKKRGQKNLVEFQTLPQHLPRIMNEVKGVLTRTIPGVTI